MDNRKLVWKIGEAIAKKHLEDKGYQILEQNYRTRYAEIDLIAKKGNVLIFVEVRTKRRELFGSPEETINQRKLKKLWLNAQGYVKTKRWLGPYRIDAICIVLNLDNSVSRLKHYQGIYG
jgi:putative endonuclease